MYGVVEISGHQYKVSPGDLIDVQKLSEEAGKDVTLDRVLFIGGETSLVGLPTVKGAKIKARIIKTERDRKIIVYRRKPGTYRKRKGHRQSFTSLLITELSDGQGNTVKIDAKSKNAEKFMKKTKKTTTKKKTEEK